MNVNSEIKEEINEIIKKKCNKCKIIKDLNDFYNDRRNYKDKKTSICKQCFYLKKDIKLKMIENKKKENMSFAQEANIKKMYEDSEYDKTKNKTSHYSMIILGSSRSGKTTKIKKIIEEIEHKYDLIFVFSNSLNDPIYNFIDYSEKSKYISLFDYDAEIIKDIFNLQRAVKNIYNILVLFDDCVSNSSKQSDALMNIFIRGRNSGISIIFSSQSPVLIGKIGRTNSNYVVICKNNSPLIIETIIENFISHQIKIDENISKRNRDTFYKDYISENTQNYKAIVLDMLNNNVYTY